MPNYPPCKPCDLVELCMISQQENYRLRDLVYPFARAECEPPSAAGGPAPEFPDILEVRTRRREDTEALAERILACLAAAGKPLTPAEIAAAVGEDHPAGQVRVKNLLARLKQAGQAHPLPEPVKRDPKSKRRNVWVPG